MMQHPEARPLTIQHFARTIIRAALKPLPADEVVPLLRDLLAERGIEDCVVCASENGLSERG